MAKLTFREAICEALAEEMELDEAVWVMGEDVASGGVFHVTPGLRERFGDLRVINTPISELAITSAAFGAALRGLRPVAEIMFGDFLGLSLDSLSNQASKLPFASNNQFTIPLVIRTAVGGGVNFGPIHSETPTNWLLGQTGLKLVAPSNPADAKGLLKSAIRDSGPVVYFEHKLLYGRSQEIEGTIEPIEIGRATVTRPGTDVTMVAALAMVGVAEKSADELSDAGISAEVIDLRSLRPLDYGAILRSATKTGHVVVVEEGPPVGGYSAEVLATLLERAPGVRGRRVTTPNIPVPFSPPLEKAVIPDVGRVSRACVELLRAVTPSVVGGP